MLNKIYLWLRKNLRFIQIARSLVGSLENKGYLLTGILGGLYSSTATTVVLSKKALSVCASEEILNILNASIIIATSMMYLRLLAIAFIFNIKIAKNLIIPMTLFAVVGVLILFILYKKNKPVKDAPINDKNPLE